MGAPQGQCIGRQPESTQGLVEEPQPYPPSAQALVAAPLACPDLDPGNLSDRTCLLASGERSVGHRSGGFAGCSGRNAGP